MPIKGTKWWNGQIPRIVPSPKTEPEEIENLNREIASNEIESVIIKKKRTQQTKVKDQMASELNSTKHLEKS